MKSSAEFKKEIDKLNSKINNNERHIKLKEAERKERYTFLNEKKKDKQSLSILKTELYNKRPTIKEELDKAKSELVAKQNYTDRLKADLLYKTKKEYEDMIRRFKNDLEVGQPYSRHEELRLLDNIKTHNQGIANLEKYEKEKQICDQLRAVHNTKKEELDENWRQIIACKEKLKIFNDEFIVLTEQLRLTDQELKALTDKRVELKKLSEDLTRENLIKQQNFKKVAKEKIKQIKKHKEDEALLHMEEALRDCIKLCNYFHKLLTHDDSQESSCGSNIEINGSGNLNLTGFSSSPNSSNSNIKPHLTSTSSSSSSLISLPSIKSTQNVQECQQKRPSLASNDIMTSKRPDPPFSLNLNASFKSIPSEAAIPSPGFISGFNLNTPIDEQVGSIYIKKKLEEDAASPKTLISNRKRNLKKSKSKSFKTSHSVEIINLLAKLGISIELSSLPEVCLKELYSRRETLQLELIAYKNNKIAEKKTDSSSSDNSATNVLIDANKNSTDPFLTRFNESQPNSFSDTKSEISSCLDSNYESDNNNGASSVSFGLSDDFESIQSINNRDVINGFPVLNSGILERQMTITNSIALTNSDDSDVTVNDVPLNIAKKKSEQMLSAEESPITLKELESGLKTPVANSFYANIQLNDNDSIREDGYCSSCTPLSASSINSEQPTKNLYFQGVQKQ